MAKTTGVINATLMAWYLGTDGSESKIVHTTNASISISIGDREITSKDSAGWQEFLEGVRGATGSADFLYIADHSTGYTMQDFYNEAVVSRSTVHAIFKSSNADDTSWEGDIRLTNIELGGGVEDNMTCNISFKFTGPITMLNT